MPIVKAICPKCGAPIYVDDAEDAEICPIGEQSLHCEEGFARLSDGAGRRSESRARTGKQGKGICH